MTFLFIWSPLNIKEMNYHMFLYYYAIKIGNFEDQQITKKYEYYIEHI